ncbi:MAG: hypothetical protein KBD37_03900 [Burkholderiales bacterium]|nr:hypothetical protein [Burkholderiales bacterium]
MNVASKPPSTPLSKTTTLVAAKQPSAATSASTLARTTACGTNTDNNELIINIESRINKIRINSHN